MSSPDIPEDVGTFFNKNYVNLKIDAEKREWIEFSKEYGVKAYPTFLFINSQNEELIGNVVGSCPAADFQNQWLHLRNIKIIGDTCKGVTKLLALVILIALKISYIYNLIFIPINNDL